MKTINLLIIPLFLSSFVTSTTAVADMDIRGERTSFYDRNKPKPLGFNYTYIEADYSHSTAEGANNDITVSSIGLGLSFDVMQKYAISFKVTGGTYNFDNSAPVEIIETQIGFFRHQPLSKSTDVFVGLKSISMDTINQTNNLSAHVRGYAIVMGARQRINSDSEWGASGTYVDIEGEKNSIFGVSYSFGSDTDTQYIIGYESASSTESSQTLIGSIRFNF